MADHCTVAGIVGKRGSGKSTLIRSYRAQARRSIVWDWKHEYEGEVIGSLRDLPDLIGRRSFSAVYRPDRFCTFRDFDALAYFLLCCGRSLLVCVDEATTATHGYREGGLTQLIRLSRQQSIDIVWATQRPCLIPGILLSEANTLHVFHLHNRMDLQALRTVLNDQQLSRVAALPPHQSVTVHL